MRMTTTMVAVVTFVLTSAPVLAALDCARVRELNRSGARPAEIAHTLGITTPEVQACLAGVVEEPAIANPPNKLPLAPQRPTDDGPIRRGPDGQNE